MHTHLVKARTASGLLASVSSALSPRRDALCPAGSRQTLTFPPVESTNRAWARFSTISPNTVTVLHLGRLGVLKTLQAVDKSGLESMAWHSARN